MAAKLLGMVVTECLECPFCHSEDGEMETWCEHPDTPEDKMVFPGFVWEKERYWIHEHCPLPSAPMPEEDN